jgi:hypothetical protein
MGTSRFFNFFHKKVLSKLEEESSWPNLNQIWTFLAIFYLFTWRKENKNTENIKDLNFPNQSRYSHQISGQLAFRWHKVHELRDHYNNLW